MPLPCALLDLAIHGSMSLRWESVNKCSLSHTMGNNKGKDGLPSNPGEHCSLYFPEFEGKSKGYLFSRA